MKHPRGLGSRTTAVVVALCTTAALLLGCGVDGETLLLRAVRDAIVSEDEAPMVSVTISDDGNGTTDPHGTIEMRASGELSVSATAAVGHRFSSWRIITGTPWIQNRDQEATVVIPSGDTHLRAEFEPLTFSMTVLATDDPVSGGPIEGVGLTPSSSQTVSYGAPQAVSFVDNEWILVTWLVDGAVTIADDSLEATTVTPYGDCSVTAWILNFPAPAILGINWSVDGLTAAVIWADNTLTEEGFRLEWYTDRDSARRSQDVAAGEDTAFLYVSSGDYVLGDHLFVRVAAFRQPADSDRIRYQYSDPANSKYQ